MYNKFFLALILVATALSCTAQQSPVKLDIKDSEQIAGMQNYSLLLPDNSSICSLTATHGKTLAAFDSPIFDAINRSEMPPDVPPVIAAVKAMKTRGDLNKMVMLGDLYVPVAHRGKGYARRLLDESCTHLLSKGFKTIALIPDPFEYEDGKKKLLADIDKREKLMKLYHSCGFATDKDTAACMYRDAANS